MAATAHTLSADGSAAAAAAIAERDEFIGMLGHELRNAIAPLMLLAEIFGDTASPDATFARRRAMLVKHLHKLCAVLDRVTEVSQLRAGKLVLHPRRADLAVLAGAACDRLEADATAAGMRLHRGFEPGVAGDWDADRAQQIVSNLVGNAIRHGGGPIDVEVRGRGAWAELVVRDHGPGIPEAARGTIFDRAGPERARAANGFGVGLWVARTLAEAMGGDVVLEPTAAGACFSLRLPRPA